WRRRHNELCELCRSARAQRLHQLFKGGKRAFAIVGGGLSARSNAILRSFAEESPRAGECSPGRRARIPRPTVRSCRRRTNGRAQAFGVTRILSLSAAGSWHRPRSYPEYRATQAMESTAE